MVDVEKIKQLREETGVSFSEVKKALIETEGDIERAKELLRKWGKELAGKKSSREVRSGMIQSYIHPNKKIGVMLDIRCETDFVAKADDFVSFSHDVCLQIAAMNPRFISEEDIPDEVLGKEKEIYAEQIKKEEKSADILEKVLLGKIEKYKKENSLLSQGWVKDNEKTIKNLLEEYIAKLGENIIIKSFVRYEIDGNNSYCNNNFIF
ncbi:MAG: elongation factor Ts [Patescibacteria group bacterium]